ATFPWNTSSGASSRAANIQRGVPGGPATPECYHRVGDASRFGPVAAAGGGSATVAPRQYSSRAPSGPAARPLAAFRFALPPPRLVHGCGGDALRGASAAAAAPRRPLDLLVLPLALVAPGFRHSRSPCAPKRRTLPCRRATYALDCSGVRGRSRRNSGSSSSAAANAYSGAALPNRSYPAPESAYPAALPAPNTTAENTACPVARRRTGTVRCIASTAQPQKTPKVKACSSCSPISPGTPRACAISAQRTEVPANAAAKSIRSENRPSSAGNARRANTSASVPIARPAPVIPEERPASRTSTPNIR